MRIVPQGIHRLQRYGFIVFLSGHIHIHIMFIYIYTLHNITYRFEL